MDFAPLIFTTAEPKGVCIDYVGIGDRCVSSNNCGSTQNFFNAQIQAPSVICNKKADSSMGICANEKDLIKDIGKECDKKKNLCDTRRGLVCDTVDGKDMCIQNSGVFGDGESFSNPCTPGSPLSTCSNVFPSGPAECRRALTTINKKVIDLTECRRAIEIVEQGSICNNFDFAVCEEGTFWRPGIGISRASVFDPSDIRDPVAYCMKEISIGETCDDSTSATFCEKGSLCVNSVCAANEPTPEVPITFSGFDGECSKKSCAPGLSCIKEEFADQKRCLVQQVSVGSGELCTSNATVTAVRKNCIEAY